MGRNARTIETLQKRIEAIEQQYKKIYDMLINMNSEKSDMDEIDKLIKELQEKADNITTLNNEINELHEDTDDDIKTVATEEAIRDLEESDIMDNPDMININADCKECLKKKHKHFKTLKKEKKKQEKDNKKKIKENILKIQEEEQRNLTLKLMSLNRNK